MVRSRAVGLKRRQPLWTKAPEQPLASPQQPLLETVTAHSLITRVKSATAAAAVDHCRARFFSKPLRMCALLCPPQRAEGMASLAGGSGMVLGSDSSNGGSSQ